MLREATSGLLQHDRSVCDVCCPLLFTETHYRTSISGSRCFNPSVWSSNTYNIRPRSLDVGQVRVRSACFTSGEHDETKRLKKRCKAGFLPPVLIGFRCAARERALIKLRCTRRPSVPARAASGKFQISHHFDVMNVFRWVRVKPGQSF